MPNGCGGTLLGHCAFEGVQHRSSEFGCGFNPSMQRIDESAQPVYRSLVSFEAAIVPRPLRFSARVNERAGDGWASSIDLREQGLRSSCLDRVPCGTLLVNRASRTEPAIRVRSLAVSCPAIRAALLPFTGMTDHPTRMIAIHVRMTPAPVVLVNDLHQLFALCADAARRILPVRQYFRCRAIPAFVIKHFFLMHQCLDGGWNGAGQRCLVFDAGWRLGIVGLAGTLGLEFVDVSRYFWRVHLGVRCSNTSSQQQAGRGK